MIYAIILALVVGYLFGSINTSIIAGKIKGIDIRNVGSGNAGATNTLRAMGKGAAAMVFLGDLLKTFIAMSAACVFAQLFAPNNEEVLKYCEYAAGIGAVIGHNFPLYFKFKGGKGIVSSLGVILFLDWRIGLILLAVSLLIMAATRYVSLGSLVGAVLYPVFVIAFNTDFKEKTLPFYILLSVAIALLALYRHRANIKRLLSGTESKLGEKKKQ